MKIRPFLLITLIFLISLSAFAQKKTKPNAEVQKMLKEISAKNIEATIRKLVSYGTRNTLSEQDNPARGIGAARDYLFGEFQKISNDCGGCLTVEKQTFTQEKAPRIPEPAVLTNIVATLKGATDPDRIYVVSGHYDSMCNLDATDAKCDAPGANDDASGTAAVVEMARVMSKYKYDATIIFMTVPGEEQGLFGSTYFAKQAVENKMNIEAMFTNDIIGGVTSYKNAPDRQTVRVFAEGVPSSETREQAAVRMSVGGENDSPSRELGRYIKETADVYSPKFSVSLIYRRDRYLRGGDHIPFLERGFPAVRFTEPHEDYTHQHQSVKVVDGVQYGDLIQFDDFDYIANVTRVNAASLAMLALAPAMPKNVGILTKKLTNDTDLQWDANKDADLAGYEVVWRDTTSAFWTNSVFVGNVTNYTAKEMSKDNYFFGVRAVDKTAAKAQSFIRNRLDKENYEFITRTKTRGGNRSNQSINA